MANSMWLSSTKLNTKGKTKQEVRDQIRKYLKRSGIGDTHKVRQVMYYAVEHGGHFTYREMYLATGKNVVASDVDKLVDAGFLKRIGIVDNKSCKHTHLYETTIGNNKQSHSHIQCTSCNKLIEFDDSTFNELGRKMADYFEFEKHHFDIQFYGRCKECQGK